MMDVKWGILYCQYLNRNSSLHEYRQHLILTLRSWLPRADDENNVRKYLMELGARFTPYNSQLPVPTSTTSDPEIALALPTPERSSTGK